MPAVLMPEPLTASEGSAPQLDDARLAGETLALLKERLNAGDSPVEAIAALRQAPEGERRVAALRKTLKHNDLSARLEAELAELAAQLVGVDEGKEYYTSRQVSELYGIPYQQLLRLVDAGAFAPERLETPARGNPLYPSFRWAKRDLREARIVVALRQNGIPPERIGAIMRYLRTLYGGDDDWTRVPRWLVLWSPHSKEPPLGLDIVVPAEGLARATMLVSGLVVPLSDFQETLARHSEKSGIDPD